jgi:benzoyl-CoA-dihydrodiol lyase
MEDSSRYEGLRFLAAVNGTVAGGGYELALACDEILMVDDRSSTVSLPEVPLLGVLPGTGGLTRLIDKRKVRRDLADVFCSTAEGVRADRAAQWNLVDAIARPQQFAASVRERTAALAATSTRNASGTGISLTPLAREQHAGGYRYPNLDVNIDSQARTATLCVRAPSAPEPDEPAAIVEAGTRWWPLAVARELDDAILTLRTNHLDAGTWILKTRGDALRVLQVDQALERHREHWLVRETIGLLRRALARLDVSSRTLFAIIDRESCFTGTLLELALAADRSYMLAVPEGESGAPTVAVSALNFGTYPMVNGWSRLATRFCGKAEPVEALSARSGEMLDAATALELGLITFAPDDIDWDDEIRLALEERASLSPDALTGMEANLRFAGPETMATRIFGRLSAWQNWIFNRPNAVGENGALKVYGSGAKARFNWERV